VTLAGRDWCLLEPVTRRFVVRPVETGAMAMLDGLDPIVGHFSTDYMRTSVARWDRVVASVGRDARGRHNKSVARRRVA
jgi:hypothetical protein